MKNFLSRARDLAVAAVAALGIAALACGPALAQQAYTLPDGSALQGHIRAMQAPGLTPPTAVGCTIAANATDMMGLCTTSAASGTITFSRTYAVAPACLIVDADATSTVSMPVYTVSATVITLTTVITAHKLFYFCLGTIASS